MRRLLVAVGLLAVLASLVAVPGAQATGTLSGSYSVAGIETGFPTNSTSSFAGGALGSDGDPGAWKASVVHQSLSNCPFGSGTSCAITGGSFSLTTLTGDDVGGTFTGGTVTPASQGTSCGNQVFSVAGTLSGSASFTATLTHYRKQIFGICVTYFATISGSLQLG
jgi:hypothetical protein